MALSPTELPGGASRTNPAAEEVWESRDFLEGLVEAAGDAILATDTAGAVRRWNRAAERMFGYRHADIVGSPLGLLWPEGSRTDAGDLLRRALGGEEVSARDLPLHRRGGHPVDVQLTLSPVRDGAGRVVGVSGIARDVTEHRLQEKEREALRLRLVQAEKMSVMGELMSGVAHELNNPLTGMIGYAQLLLDRPCDDGLRRNLARIQEEAQRCHRVVQKLLAFARQRRADRLEVDLNRVLEATLDLCAYPMRVDNIWVVRDLQADLPRVEGDPHLLQQVFMNLLSNAHQALAAAGGVVTVATRRCDDRVEVKISDNGPGIPPEIVSRIFEPFFTTKAEEGTGLGLSICQGIVREHRGELTADSRPGVETAFTVRLPAWAAAPLAEPAPAAAAARTEEVSERPCRVLVVDDEDTIREFLEETLRSRGHAVDTAANGVLALERIGTGAYDAVITDLKMPTMNGRQFFEALRRDHPGLAGRVIFATGDLVARQTIEFLESTGNPYLEKPFSIRSLAEALLQLEAQNSMSSAGR